MSTSEVVPKEAAVSDVVAQIRATIATEELQPGARVGTERDLASQYNVTRWVIRKALAELESDNTILRVHGRNGGIFVAREKIVRDLDRLVGLPEYLRAQGLETGTTVLGTRVERAEGNPARQLQVTSNDHLYVIERVRFAEGIPLSVETIYVPTEKYPGLLDHSLVGSLYDLLESRYKVKRGEAVETITAIPANAKQAETLQLAAGAPLLAVERTALLESGEPFEHGLEYYRFDRMAISVHTSSPAHIERQIT